MIFNPGLAAYGKGFQASNQALTPQQRIDAFLPGSTIAGRPAEEAIAGRVRDIARDPYQMPFDSRAQGLRALTGAGNRVRMAGGPTGNIGLARGHGEAILNRDYEQMQQELGDERIARILLPFLGQQNSAYAAALEDFMAQPKKKKKKSSLKRLVGTAADTYLNMQTGGGWGAATGGGMSR